MPKLSKRNTTYFLIIIVTIIISVSCTNPMMNRLMDQIETDVIQTLAGPSPDLRSVSPASDSIDISTSITIEAEFDVEMDPETLTSETVKLIKVESGAVVSTAVIYNGDTKTVSISPSAVLEKETKYQLIFTSEVKSLPGAALTDDLTIDFTTRYFHDTEIGIDFTYFSGDLVLDEDKPIYIQFWPSPLEYPVDPDLIPVLTSEVISSSGKFAITQSSLPTNVTAGMLKFFHDLDEDYPVGEETEDADDSISWYSSEGTGNMISDDASDGILIIPDPDSGSFFIDTNGEVVAMTGNVPDSLPAFYSLNPDLIVSAGNGYSVLFSDGSPFEADPFETAESINSYRNLDHGTYESGRNLHTPGDEDYLKFTPEKSDMYEIRVKETSFELKIGLYDDDSDMFTETNSLSPPDTGSAARVINSGGTYLVGGTEYYLRIESPTDGLGWYEIGYFYKSVDADGFEDADDIPGTAPVLSFGRDNAVTRTIEAGWDKDYFEIEIQNNGLDYMIEVVEVPSYFHPSAESRNIIFDLSLEDSGGSGMSAFGLNDRTMLIKASDDWNYPAGTYYVSVENNSAVIGDEQNQPCGEYQILLTYAYDGLDQPDNSSTAGFNEYDQYNEHSLTNGYGGYVYVAPEGTKRTIYSVPPSNPDNDSLTDNPGDDVDWVKFNVYMPYIDYLIYTEPIGGLDADGIVVDFELYPSHDIGNGDEPDTSSGPFTGGQPWLSDDAVKGVAYPVYSESTFFAKIFRDSDYPSNPITGAYRFYVIVGADEADSNNPDSEVTVYDGAYGSSNIIYTGGVDETPWIEKDSPGGFTDYSIRNQLPDWESYEISGVYRTLYRSDYDFRGESDGTTQIYSDVDFFWYEVPPQMDGLPIDVFIGNFVISYSIPLKLSLWNITAAEWAGLKSDTVPGVITEAELSTADYVFTYYTSESYKIEELNIAGGAAGDFVVLKVEADTANLGATYQDINDDDGIYEDSGQYDIRIRRHY